MSEELIECPICKDQVDRLQYPMHEAVDRVVLEWIRQQHPEWVDEEGLCPRCLELYRRMKESQRQPPGTSE